MRSRRSVAQSGSASALGAEGRWFESGRPDHLFTIADEQPSGCNEAAQAQAEHLLFSAFAGTVSKPRFKEIGPL